MIRKSRAYDLAALYTSGALWNICMGMLQVLVPLYALSLGFSIVKISSLVSLPVLVELVVRFGGGALSDRFGERRVLQICFFSWRWPARRFWLRIVTSTSLWRRRSPFARAVSSGLRFSHWTVSSPAPT